MAEQKTLRELYWNTHSATMGARCQTIPLAALNYAVSEIAAFTLFNEDSILYWLDRYESKGLSGLEDRPGLGVVPQVNGLCEAELKKMVEQDPRQAGHNFSTWTCAHLLRELVKKGFRETIQFHLHALGYRVLRPVLSIPSPDPAYQQKVNHGEKCQKQAKNGEILLYFQDEIDLNLLPGIVPYWTLHATPRRVVTHRVNPKRYGLGAVNYVTGHTLCRTEEHKNSAGFCASVEQSMKTVFQSPAYHGQKILLVVDNSIVHHSRKSRQFFEQSAYQLILFALPTYSPWLNTIELLW